MLERLSYGKPLGFRVKTRWWLFSSKRPVEMLDEPQSAITDFLERYQRVEATAIAKFAKAKI